WLGVRIDLRFRCQYSDTVRVRNLWNLSCDFNRWDRRSCLSVRRNELFDQASSPANKKIGGIPIISILGLIATLVGVGVASAGVTPAFTGSPVNPLYLLFLGFVFLLGVILYEISNIIRKGQGINRSLTFKEGPRCIDGCAPALQQFLQQLLVMSTVLAILGL